MGTGIHFILLNLQEHTGEDFLSYLTKEIQLELSFFQKHKILAKLRNL